MEAPFSFNPILRWVVQKVVTDQSQDGAIGGRGAREPRPLMRLATACNSISSLSTRRVLEHSALDESGGRIRRDDDS